jgi:DNA (cytosine-5)-methyltransferase 1
MAAYYNEFDPYAAQWLRNLIKNGLIADGDVDDRSIRDVASGDLKGYTQCHFFAGIGVWSHALRLAGWDDARPVWTGSCPCQPFSAAGQGKGVEDERHLWPEFHRLIAECRPSVVFGEQVASKDGLGWLDAVCADMDASGYAIGAADLCAAGIGAPHIRQRLWFVAERLADAEHNDGRPDEQGWRTEGRTADGRGSADVRLADTDSQDTGGRRVQRPRQSDGAGAGAACERPAGLRADGRLADTRDDGSQGRLSGRPNAGRETLDGSAGRGGADSRPSATNGHWRDADWLFCRDGKWRPVEPGTFPLAHGAAARVGRLRAYGNAIVPQAAAEVIGAYLAT